MSIDQPRRPEGLLLRSARKRAGLSITAAAAKANVGPDQWGNIERGYASKAKDRDVIAPRWTLADMAASAGVTPEELEEAGRADAAEELRSRTARSGPHLAVVPDELTDSVIDAFIAAVPEEHHRKVLWWRWRETDAENNLKPREERLRALVDWVQHYMPKPESSAGPAARENTPGNVV